MRTRSKTAKPAALGPTDKKAVTGVGAPWVSGDHWLKGTSATLKAIPTSTIKRAGSTRPEMPPTTIRSGSASDAATRGSDRLAGHAVKHRQAVEHDGARHRTVEEVLQPAFGRQLVAAQVGHDVAHD